MSYKEAPLRKIKRVPFASRKNKVRAGMFTSPAVPGRSLAEFTESIPRILAGNDLKNLCLDLAAASRAGGRVLWLVGAHVIKCGLSRHLITLMDRGVINHLALNGAGAVHDLEIALFGETSEDVAENLENGTFGMARETAQAYHRAARHARKKKIGLGEALGGSLITAPHADLSLLAAAFKRNIPATVHVALGTDIVHQHPEASGRDLGESSLRDFRILAASAGSLDHRGGVVNLGSAVILPEVFLKALAVARNLGGRKAARNFFAANLDFIQAYRSRLNVVARPTGGGKSRAYLLTGHHEIMVPLLTAWVLEELA